MNDELWTIREAAGVLHPRFTRRTIQRLVTRMGIPVQDQVRTGGRPAYRYRAVDLIKAHAQLVMRYARESDLTTRQSDLK